MMNKNNKKGLAALLLAASLGCLSVGIVSVQASDEETEVAFSDSIDIEDTEENAEEVTSEDAELTIEQETEDKADNSETEVELEADDLESMDGFADGETNLEAEELTDEAQECGTEENTVFWSLNDEGVLSVTGQGTMQEWNCEEEVPWNSVRQDIRKIEISDGVRSIGAYAFCNCSNVTETEIPESVQEIGEYAFFNCSGLSSMTIG